MINISPLAVTQPGTSLSSIFGDICTRRNCSHYRHRHWRCYRIGRLNKHRHPKSCTAIFAVGTVHTKIFIYVNYSICRSYTCIVVITSARRLYTPVGTTDPVVTVVLNTTKEVNYIASIGIARGRRFIFRRNC